MQNQIGIKYDSDGASKRLQRETDPKIARQGLQINVRAINVESEVHALSIALCNPRSNAEAGLLKLAGATLISFSSSCLMRGLAPRTWRLLPRPFLAELLPRHWHSRRSAQ